MKKIVKLSEKDLSRIVKRVIKEEEDDEFWRKYGHETEDDYYVDYAKSDDYASDLLYDMEEHIKHIFYNLLNEMDLQGLIEMYQNEFKESEHSKYLGLDVDNEGIDSLMELKVDSNINFDDLAYELMDKTMMFLKKHSSV